MRDESVVTQDINDTFRVYPRDKCLDEIFRSHVVATPDAVAIRQGDRVLTYRQLDSASNRLAQIIVGRQLDHESIIGLCIERSPEMMIAMLAILKAGHAYLPLDTDYPLERLNYMVSDANCGLLIGTSHQLELVAASDRPQLDLDDIWPRLETVADEPPMLIRASSDLAYVMYTSGTTGNPKGVAVTHFNVSRLVINTNYVDLQSTDVFLQLAPIAFDASTFEIWGALLNGATLVLYDRPQMDIGHIQSIIAREQVTVLWLSSGFFNQAVETSIALFDPIRQLLVGGDVLSVTHVRKVMDRLPGCQLINGYGPTECTTFSVCCRITPDDITDASVPIGRPIANAQAFILDDNRHPVPPGTVGELYIGGDGVARGYLGAPDATAAKFVTITVNGRPHRVYRTGDLVHLAADGLVHFHGRADRQIKVRGFRIEPAEIEAAILKSCNAVEQAVVIGSVDKQGNKRLVAYLNGPSGTLPGSVDLRDRLRETLPPYMIPATFVYLDAIPLTPNGKVDRNNLPTPEWRPMSRYGADMLRTPLERRVGEIYRETTSGTDLPRLTSSLELGEDTSSTASVLDRFRTEFGLPMDRTVLKSDDVTIATIVNALRGALSEKPTTKP